MDNFNRINQTIDDTINKLSELKKELTNEDIDSELIILNRIKSCFNLSFLNNEVDDKDAEKVLIMATQKVIDNIKTEKKLKNGCRSNRRT